jgi:arginyl-tRNA synthetase
MSVFHTYTKLVHDAVATLIAEGTLPALNYSKVAVEPPRDPAHGDLATNAAMVLAKPAGKAPRDVAAALSPLLQKLPAVTSLDVAGPGFINIRLEPGVWHDEIKEILERGIAYGDSEEGANAPPINIEYVSANPTGPLHAAHARGAIIGDALANLLEKTGHRLTREYYLNDAGNQVAVLGRSTYLRYREALGEVIGEIPSGYYPGDYLKEIGEKLAARDGNRWLDKPEDEWLPVMRDFAIDTILGEIKTDLAALGIEQDVISSERRLVEKGAVQKALDRLQALGLLYEGILEAPKGKTPEDWEPRPQLLFKSSQFGDDVDRPLKKSDGSFTYFANDIAYHFDKIERGSNDLIDIMGADHGGYVKRMQAAVTAISGGKAQLDLKLCQIVHVLDNGVPVRMSKRAGSFITLRDVIERVGRDVIRFIMLTRRNDQTLEFDYAKVTEQSKDNPVFYVQYAHARCCSVLRHAAALPGYNIADETLNKAELTQLNSPEEMQLIKVLATWPRVVSLASEAHEPHRVAFYLQEVAASFHHLWTAGKENTSLRFIDEANAALTKARLALVRAVALVIASGLNVIGVEPMEEMR